MRRNRYLCMYWGNGILPYRCSNTKESLIGGHCCNCSKIIESNRIFCQSRCEPPVEDMDMCAYDDIFSHGMRASLHRPSKSKSQRAKVEKQSSKQTRKGSGSDSDFNSPAIILLKRQRSTGLGRAGAMDCLRRCIVISGRRPGGAMVGCVLDDVLFCNCVLLLDG